MAAQLTGTGESAGWAKCPFFLKIYFDGPPNGLTIASMIILTIEGLPQPQVGGRRDSAELAAHHRHRLGPRPYRPQAKGVAAEKEIDFCLTVA